MTRSARTLVASYDRVLLDLDGTLYRSDAPVPGAAAAVLGLRATGIGLGFVTNNASRTPGQVVAHLASVGVSALEAEVLTAAQAGARVLAGLVPAGSAVLVVGGEGLVAAVLDEGLRPVGRMSEEPAAVIQGWWPGLAWSQLAEGAYALARGLPWVATNTDATLPTADGVAPGNGSFVSLLQAVTGRCPEAVAGKPGPELLRMAAGGSRALVVGDRLETDMAGAAAAGMDSALVLTGVSTLPQALAATGACRPTYVCRDLGAVLRDVRAVVPTDEGHWSCGAVTVAVRSGRLEPVRIPAAPHEEEVLDDLVRATCAAAWVSADNGSSVVPADSLLEILG